MAAATTVFLLPVLGLAAGQQEEVSKTARLISKNTNITAKALTEINQEIEELRTAVLQNRATKDYLLLKHNLGYQQLTGVCCLNISDFSHTVYNQIVNLHKERDKIS